MRDHVIIYDFRCAQRVNYENLLKLAPNSNHTHSDPTQKMKRPMERKNNEWRGCDREGEKMPQQNGIAASRQWERQWLTKQNKSRRLLAPAVSVCRCSFSFFSSFLLLLLLCSHFSYLLSFFIPCCQRIRSTIMICLKFCRSCGR